MHFLKFMLALAAAGMATGCSPAGAPRTGTTAISPGKPAADSAAVHQTAVSFLAAFDSLQWEPFRASFSDDVTMFFPFSSALTRADGRAAVEAGFRPFFEQGRQALAQSNRNRQGLAPRDLLVQALGDAAVVSFHLGAGDRPARRSLVFRRAADGTWKVVHWHASNPPPAPAPSGTPRD